MSASAEPRPAGGMVLTAPSRPERAVAGESRGHVPLWFLIDFLIGMGFVWDRFPVPALGAQPFGMVLIAVALVAACFRRRTLALTAQLPIVAVYAVMLLWAVIVSEANGLTWQQRALKLVLLLLFALCLATQRIDARQVLLGLTTGLVVNVGMFYAGLTQNDYPPYLTGFLGDKNIAGLMYAVVGVAGLALYRSNRLRLLHVVFFASCVWLTGSRTSIAAVVAGLIWMLARNRLWLVARLGLAAALFWALAVVETEFARVGLFSDREGTDWFRAQIDLATVNKLALSPWYGDGLTTAFVNLDGGRFMFFHDSYAALRIEGGWPMVIAMLVLVLGFGGGLFRASNVPPALAIVEGGIVVVLVCAWKLGEVFFTTPAFLLLGLAWGLRYGVPESPDISGVDAPRRAHAAPDPSMAAA